MLYISGAFSVPVEINVREYNNAGNKLFFTIFTGHFNTKSDQAGLMLMNREEAKILSLMCPVL